MPERFKVVCTMQGAIQVLSFTFTFTFYMMAFWTCWLTDRRLEIVTPKILMNETRVMMADGQPAAVVYGS